MRCESKAAKTAVNSCLFVSRAGVWRGDTVQRQREEGRQRQENRQQRSEIHRNFTGNSFSPLVLSCLLGEKQMERLMGREATTRSRNQLQPPSKNCCDTGVCVRRFYCFVRGFLPPCRLFYGGWCQGFYTCRRFYRRSGFSATVPGAFQSCRHFF